MATADGDNLSYRIVRIVFVDGTSTVGLAQVLDDDRPQTTADIFSCDPAGYVNEDDLRKDIERMNKALSLPIIEVKSRHVSSSVKKT